MTFDQRAEWLTAFHNEVDEVEAESGFERSEWRAANRGREDIDWWGEHGLEMVQSYIDWREQTDWPIWYTPAGKPAIELDLTVTYEGARLRSIIDRAFVPDGRVLVVDLKTGSRTPDTGWQLAQQAICLEAAFPGVSVKYGAFWMARKGTVSPPMDLTVLKRVVPKASLMFEQARREGLFIPNVGEHCKRCGVAYACAAVGGAEANKYDPLAMEGGKSA